MWNTGSANTLSSPLSPDFYYILSSSQGMYTVIFEIILKKSMYEPGEYGTMNYE
jgi:hypothetical protein